MKKLTLCNIPTSILLIGLLAPAACQQEIDGPKPQIEQVSPGAICTEQISTIIDIRGQGLSILPIDTATSEAQLALPLITLSGQSSLLPEGESPQDVIINNVALDSIVWNSEQHMQFSISPELSMPSGIYNLNFQNPNEYSHSFNNAIIAVPAPTITSITPQFICNAQNERIIGVTGTWFAQFEESVPTAYLDSDEFDVAIASQSCHDIDGSSFTLSLCAQGTITIPADELAPGSHAVQIVNPHPLQCSTTELYEITVISPPTITSISPAEFCTESGRPSFVISGDNFVATNENNPTVIFNDGITDSFGTVLSYDGCTDIDSSTDSVFLCTQILAEFPISPMITTATAYNTYVQNPLPVGCISNAYPITRYPAPEITDVSSTHLCSGGALGVTGMYFDQNINVYLDGTSGISASAVNVSNDGSSLSASFGQFLVGGSYQLSVVNPGGCESVFNAENITIDFGPIAFFAAPEVIYNGITNQIIVYAKDLIAPVSVSLFEISSSTTITIDPGNVDYSDVTKISIALDQSIPAGVYDIYLDGSGGGCTRAVLDSGLSVVENTDLVVTGISPQFGWSGESTAITIDATTDNGGFIAIPRVYLANINGTNAASPLQAVSFINNTTITALVPAGLPDDSSYNIVIVNPNGSVGVLEDAYGVFSIKADPPPTIDSVSPGSVPTLVASSITINGSNFRNPEVNFECIDGTTDSSTDFFTIDASTATTIDISYTFGAAYNSGAYCIIRVTNDDGTFADFSSLVITNSGQKLFGSSQGPSLEIGRRGLAAVAGRVSSAARYLYALGGDAGSDFTTVYDTVEVAAVNIYGRPSSFSVLQYPMQTPRTLAQGIISDRFVYMIGGTSDGSTALESVERAYILSPDQRPIITDMDLQVTDEAGLDEGVYQYQVAAVMASDNSFNPGGQTLPSESFVVRIPQMPGTYKVHTTIYWSAVADAQEYYIYRLKNSSTSSEQIQLIGISSSTSYTDDNSVIQPAQPLQVGALGRWHTPTSQVDGTSLALAAPRMGAGAIRVVNFDGSSFALYVFGGASHRDLTTKIATVHDSYQYAVISIESDGRQEVLQNFTEITTNPLPSGARWQLGAFWANPNNAPNVGTEDYIYVGAGIEGNRTVGDHLDVARIAWPSFELDSFQNSIDFGNYFTMYHRAGYGSLLINNFIFTFGGITGGGVIDLNNDAAEICSYIGDGCGGAGNPKNAPEFDNWTSAGPELFVERYLMGTALESAFIYIIGGATDAEEASTSTEMMVW